MRNLAEVSILFDNVDRKLPIDTEQVELKELFTVPVLLKTILMDCPVN